MLLVTSINSYQFSGSKIKVEVDNFRIGDWTLYHALEKMFDKCNEVHGTKFDGSDVMESRTYYNKSGSLVGHQHVIRVADYQDAMLVILYLEDLKALEVPDDF